MTLLTQVPSRDHVHDHSHDHAHAHGPASHDHASHDHGAHADRTAEAPRRAHPGFSLLRMSSMQRLALALILVATIWLGVFWAWS